MSDTPEPRREDALLLIRSARIGAEAGGYHGTVQLMNELGAAYDELQRERDTAIPERKATETVLADTDKYADEAVKLLRDLIVTGCREWVDNDRCNAPAEFVLWGKLIDPEGLGPRCYDHAAKWVDHRGLGDPSYAILDLRPGLRFLSRRGVAPEDP